MDSLKLLFSNRKMLKKSERLGEDRIMDSLKRFFFTQENFRIQKRLGEDRIMDSLIFLKYFFSDYGLI